MQMLEDMTGIDLTPVHYRGGAPALTDVLAGHVPAVFLSLTLTAQPWRAYRSRFRRRDCWSARTLRRSTMTPDPTASVWRSTGCSRKSKNCRNSGSCANGLFSRTSPRTGDADDARE